MTRRQSISHLIPGYRVFVYGQEITQDVLSVSVNFATGRNLDNCQIVLSNERDRYKMTTADIASLAMDGSFKDVLLGEGEEIAFLASSFVEDRVSALAENMRPGWSITPDGPNAPSTAGALGEIAARSEFSVKDTKSLKSKIVLTKLQKLTVTTRTPVQPPAQGRTQDIKGQAKDTGRIQDVGEASTGEQIIGNPSQAYEFFDGRSVFHAMDPVRVFFKEPDPDVRDPDTGGIPWYYAFAGFVSTIADAHDPKGQKVITLGCEDVRKNLRFSMIVPNVALYDAKELEALADKIPQLQQFTSPYSNPAAGMNFTDGLTMVIFGTRLSTTNPAGSAVDTTNVPVPKSGGNQGSTQVTISGVGRFDYTRAKIQTFGKDPSNDLMTWQNTITNRVRLDDPTTMANTNIGGSSAFAATNPNFTIDDVITHIGSDPFAQYPVEGTLWVLLPDEANFEKNNRVLTEELNKYIDNNLKMLDRLNLLYALVARVGFEMYCHPKGNITIEFPLYDFYPTDFVPKDLMSGPQSGPASANLRDFILFDDRTESVNTTFSDQNLRTVYLSTPVLGIELGLGGKSGQDIGLRAQAEVLVPLIPIYGIRIERGDMDGALVTEEAAKVWAKIALRRLNSNAFSASVPMALNPRYWLNRPVLWESCNHLGTIQKISHTITWAGTAQSNVTLSYMRGWKGNMENGRPLYEPIGGKQSTPLNYRDLFYGVGTV